MSVRLSVCQRHKAAHDVYSCWQFVASKWLRALCLRYMVLFNQITPNLKTMEMILWIASLNPSWPRPCISCCPAARSIGRDTKFTVCLCFCMYGYGFLSRGFTDRCEILHGGSTWSRTGLLLFWEDSTRDGRVMDVNRAPCGGICFLLKQLFVFYNI